MNWIAELVKVLPVLAGMTDNKIDDLIAKLVLRAEDEIERRQSDNNQTRAEVLADAAETYERVLGKIEAGKKLGHEDE